MIIHIKQKWVFVSIQRCGTHTMYNILCRCGGKHIKDFRKYHPRDYHCNVIPYDFKDYFHFSILRNPYSRMVGWWAKTHKIRSISENMSFVEWLRHVNGGVSQVQQIGHLNISYYLHLENLKSEILDLPFKLNEREALSIPQLNKSNHKPYMDYMTKEAITIINEHYETDFLLGGYERMKI